MAVKQKQFTFALSITINTFTMAKLQQQFIVTVWYRYVIAGEQEKDFDVHTVSATDEKEAAKFACQLYAGLKVIPFGFYINNEKIEL